ncbi:substrate-binding domain-containing protein [Effusibacillus consociatus]|uniref:Substrate-binding domain-containing protein n=1 Tax=Effusibacillus consociatus TaxID=1117041 RepID=A0ABV9Q2Q2_9BACL
MKRIAFLFMSMILMAGLILAGCGANQTSSGNGTDKPASSESKKIVIGVSVATSQEAVYKFMEKAMRDNEKKDGVEIKWVSANNDANKQVADVENLIAQKVDAIILHAVNTGTAKNIVKKAEDAKIPVIAMDRLPEDAKVVAYVTADSFKVGQTQAEFILKQINNKGNVVILEGEAGNSVAKAITAGNKDALSKVSDVKIVASQPHQAWARDKALATIENLIAKGEKIDAVLANNSGMAMGAVQALKAKGLIGNVAVIGSDADKDASQSILKGELRADIDKKPYDLGLGAYKIALAVAKKQDWKAAVSGLGTVSTQDNGTAGKVDALLTPIKLITKDNVKDMEERWGKLD